MEFVRKLKDIEVMEKETASFKCELSKSGVKVKWLYNGKAITDEDGLDIKVDKSVHTLTLEDVALEDAGNYAIQADDKQSMATLSVRGNDSTK